MNILHSDPLLLYASYIAESRKKKSEKFVFHFFRLFCLQIVKNMGTIGHIHASYKKKVDPVAASGQPPWVVDIGGGNQKLEKN